jgi:hypothetical protein
MTGSIGKRRDEKAIVIIASMSLTALYEKIYSYKRVFWPPEQLLTYACLPDGMILNGEINRARKARPRTALPNVNHENEGAVYSKPSEKENDLWL